MKNLHQNTFLFHPDRLSYSSFAAGKRFVFEGGGPKESGGEGEKKGPDTGKKEVTQLGYSMELQRARQAVQPYLEVSIQNATISMEAQRAKSQLDALDVKVDTLDDAAKQSNISKMKAIMDRFREYPAVNEKKDKAADLKKAAEADAPKKAAKVIDALKAQYEKDTGAKMSDALAVQLSSYQSDLTELVLGQIDAATLNADKSIINMDAGALKAQGTLLDGVIAKLEGTDTSFNKAVDKVLLDGKVVAEGMILAEMSKDKDPEKARKFVTAEIDARIAALPRQGELDKDSSRAQEAKLTQLRDQILASLDAAKAPADAMKRFSIMAYFQDQLNSMDVKPGTPDAEKPKKVAATYLERADSNAKIQSDALEDARKTSGTLAQRLVDAEKKAKEDPSYKVDPKLRAEAAKAYLRFREQEKRSKDATATYKEAKQMPGEPPLAKAPDIGVIATSDSVKKAIDGIQEGKGQIVVDGIQVNVTRLGAPTFQTAVYVDDNPNLGITTNIVSDPFSVADKVAQAVRAKKEKDSKSPPPQLVATN